MAAKANKKTDTMREQEQQSQAFWDQVAHEPSRGVIPGLLCEDAEQSKYRDAAEKCVFTDQVPELFQSDMTVLEVGCGGGRWTGWIAEQCKAMYAVDLSPNMIAMAKQRNTQDNIEWHSGTVMELNDTVQFEIVYLSSCMHYMSIPAIEEMLRWIDQHSTQHCQIITRDTVSLLGHSFHRSERYSNDDPAIYRTVDEYEALLGVYNWSLVQSWPTYLSPRFRWLHKALSTSLVHRFQQRELRLLPERIRQLDWKEGPGDKKHCFFLYRR